jgi:hypothetical protein
MCRARRERWRLTRAMTQRCGGGRQPARRRGGGNRQQWQHSSTVVNSGSPAAPGWRGNGEARSKSGNKEVCGIVHQEWRQQ